MQHDSRRRGSSRLRGRESMAFASERKVIALLVARGFVAQVTLGEHHRLHGPLAEKRSIALQNDRWIWTDSIGSRESEVRTERIARHLLRKRFAGGLETCGEFRQFVTIAIQSGPQHAGAPGAWKCAGPRDAKAQRFGCCADFPHHGRQRCEILFRHVAEEGEREMKIPLRHCAKLPAKTGNPHADLIAQGRVQVFGNEQGQKKTSPCRSGIHSRKNVSAPRAPGRAPGARRARPRFP